MLSEPAIKILSYPNPTLSYTRIKQNKHSALFIYFANFFAKKGGIFTVGSVFVVRLCVRLEFGGDFHGWL